MRVAAIRFALPVAAVFVALAIAEVALRVGGFGESTVYLHAGILRHHPALGWEKRPSTTAVYTFEGATIVESSNRDGMRGEERPGEKPAGELRVLAVGDSFCEGYLVNDEEVFSAVVERGWRGTGRLAVLNAGVAGYSTDQELLYFRESGVRYTPDVTVIFFFDNDVWFNTQVDEYRSKKPRFVISEAGLALEGVPVPAPARDTETAPAGEGFFGEHFRVVRVLGDRAARIPWLRRWSTKPAGAGDSEAPRAAGAPVDLPGEFKVYKRGQPGDVREAWRVTEEILSEFKRDAEAAGGRLAVFYVPTVAAIYPEAWEATKRRWGLNDEEWSIEQVEPALAEVCERQRIDFIATMAEFRAEANRALSASGPLYYMDDGHWNAAGHAVAAEILKRYLMEQFLD